MKLRTVTLLTAAAVLVAGTYYLRDATAGADPEAAPQPIASTNALPADALPEVNRLISLFEERIVTRTDSLDYRTLGRHYLEQGGLTGDPASYRRAGEVLAKSLQLAPDHVEALTDLTLAHMGTHQFGDALLSISTAVALEPANPRSQLILGDVLFSLGRYGEARTQFDNVALKAPDDPAVLIRQAELSWHTGDNSGAISLSRQASESAEANGVDRRSLAFYLTEHGHHLTNNGLIADGIEILSKAVEIDPLWAPPRAELARAHSLQGDYAEAIQNLEAALGQAEDIGWQDMLVTLYELVGDTDSASAARGELTAMVIAAESQGAVYARQVARVLANDLENAQRGLEIAAAETSGRRDVYGLDLYAWALYQVGEVEHAWTTIQSALDIGTRDPAILYSAGVIAVGAGYPDQGAGLLAAALEVNPRFDPVLAPDAASRLEVLG